MDIIESAARPQAGPQVVADSLMKTFNEEKAKDELELALEQEEINEATARKEANKIKKS